MVLGRVWLLQLVEITRFNRLSPELKDGQRDQGNDLDLDTRRNSIMVCIRRFVKVFFSNI